MRKIFKADIYRLFRSKGLYITFICLILFGILVGSSQGTVGVMVSTETSSIESNFSGSKGTEVTQEREKQINAKRNGLETVKSVMENGDSSLYFILPFIIFIAAADFSFGITKNLIGSGTSRKKYYFSKWLLSLFMAIMVYTIFILVGFMTASIVSGNTGIGQELLGGWNLETLMQGFLLQLWLILGATSLGVFLVFLTKKTAIVNSIFIAFTSLPLIVIIILTETNSRFNFLVNYEYILNIRQMANIHMLETGSIVRAIILGFIMIAATTIVGIKLFAWQDIK